MFFFDPSPSKWRMVLAERHGAIVKLMMMHMVAAMNLSSLVALRQACLAALAAKNRTVNKGGVSSIDAGGDWAQHYVAGVSYPADLYGPDALPVQPGHGEQRSAAAGRQDSARGGGGLSLVGFSRGPAAGPHFTFATTHAGRHQGRCHGPLNTRSLFVERPRHHCLCGEGHTGASKGGCLGGSRLSLWRRFGWPL